MGITANSNQTQLWSVIPYAVATPVTGKPHTNNQDKPLK